MTVLELPSGRSLDLFLSGPADGVPLIAHHGTPGGGFQLRAMQRAAAGRGLRLVSWSRPGYGASSRQEGRTIASIVDDLAAVLDHLDAPRCVVIGHSGGGPHAAACGALLPSRVAGVVVSSGVGPYGVAGLDFLAGMGEQNITEFEAALAGEVALRPYLEKEALEMRGVDAAGLIAALSTLLPEVDRAVLTDEFAEDLIASFEDGLRLGVDGWLDDDLAFTRPWGFALASIAVPTFVWQGDADLMVPFAHGQWLAEQIPGVTAQLLPGEGHLSITVGHLDDMLDELVAVL